MNDGCIHVRVELVERFDNILNRHLVLFEPATLSRRPSIFRRNFGLALHVCC